MAFNEGALFLDHFASFQFLQFFGFEVPDDEANVPAGNEVEQDIGQGRLRALFLFGVQLYL